MCTLNTAGQTTLQLFTNKYKLNVDHLVPIITLVQKIKYCVFKQGATFSAE